MLQCCIGAGHCIEISGVVVHLLFLANSAIVSTLTVSQSVGR